MPIPNEELNQFKPGQSGNPNGRPIGPITQFLREFGDATEIRFSIEINKLKDGKPEQSIASSTISTNDQTINQAVAARLLQMAMNGDIKAIREVLNRTEGRVPQPIRLAGADGGPVQVQAYIPEFDPIPLDE